MPKNSNSTTTTPTRKARGRLVAGVLGGLALLAGGAYIAGYFLAGDNLPRNTTIAGVSVGGLNRDQAIAKLNTDLAARAQAPITMSANGKAVTRSPAQLGLVVDTGKSVDDARPQRSWDPVRIWFVLTGGGAQPAAISADTTKLVAGIAELAKLTDGPAKDATIALKGTQIVQTPGVPETAVDQPAAAKAVQDAYLSATTVAVPVKSTDPAITTDEANQVVADFVRPALSAPVKMTAGQRTFDVTPQVIAGAISFESAGGTITPKVDPVKLRAGAGKVIDALGLAKPRNASFKFVDGKPVVVPSADGVDIAAPDLAAAVTPVLAKSGAERAGKVEAKTSKPALTTEAANNLGIKEITGSFTTYFPGDSYRFTNLGQAAKGISGSLVLPNQIWSLNDRLGERTIEKGYVEGGVIADGGTLRHSVGGGISQSATTTFNAIFFAGLKDIEHHPHTLYFDRYPAGREATVSWGSLDLKFQNDTKYGVLLQAWINRLDSGGGSITVRVWSTKTYTDVKATAPQKSNFTSGTTRYDTSSQCVGQGFGEGFDVTYQRLFYQGNQIVKRESFSWQYEPMDRVICGPDPNKKR